MKHPDWVTSATASTTRVRINGALSVHYVLYLRRRCPYPDVGSITPEAVPPTKKQVCLEALVRPSKQHTRIPPELPFFAPDSRLAARAEVLHTEGRYVENIEENTGDI